jgi:hypothetical protein
MCFRNSSGVDCCFVVVVDLYQSYIQNGFLTDELISAALCLAHLEGSHRSGIFNEADLVTSDERDVADLRQLMSLVWEQDFLSRKACYLNPTLGSTDSNADLIIDDKLIDIKTTKYLVLDRRHLHQLVQYYDVKDCKRNCSCDGCNLLKNCKLCHCVSLHVKGYSRPFGPFAMRRSGPLRECRFPSREQRSRASQMREK